MDKKRSALLRKRHRAQIARARAACHICGKPIDYSLKWPDPMCFVVDHVVAIANGGSDVLSNKAASHSGCNSKKGARVYAPVVRRSGALD